MAAPRRGRWLAVLAVVPSIRRARTVAAAVAEARGWGLHLLAVAATPDGALDRIVWRALETGGHRTPPQSSLVYLEAQRRLRAVDQAPARLENCQRTPVKG
jgi:hypothetical protein